MIVINTNAPRGSVVYNDIGHKVIVINMKTNVRLNIIVSLYLKKLLINFNIVIINIHEDTKQYLLVNIYRLFNLKQIKLILLN